MNWNWWFWQWICVNTIIGSKCQDIENTFCLFGLVNYPISSSEDGDATDDHSEVIANEHIQDKPIGIETNEEIITSEFVHDKHDEAEKDNEIIKPVSHQIRMACNVCSKVLNVKSMKAHMRNIHGIGGEASKQENIGEVKLTTKRVRTNGIWPICLIRLMINLLYITTFINE